MFARVLIESYHNSFWCMFSAMCIPVQFSPELLWPLASMCDTSIGISFGNFSFRPNCSNGRHTLTNCMHRNSISGWLRSGRSFSRIASRWSLGSSKFEHKKDKLIHFWWIYQFCCGIGRACHEQRWTIPSNREAPCYQENSSNRDTVHTVLTAPTVPQQRCLQ